MLVPDFSVYSIILLQTCYRSYHEDVVTEIMEQLDSGAAVVDFDTHIGMLRDRSTRWIWNAYKAINNENLVKKVRIFLLKNVGYNLPFYRHSKNVPFGNGIFHMIA